MVADLYTKQFSDVFRFEQLRTAIGIANKVEEVITMAGELQDSRNEEKFVGANPPKIQIVQDGGPVPVKNWMNQVFVTLLLVRLVSLPLKLTPTIPSFMQTMSGLRGVSPLYIHLLRPRIVKILHPVGMKA